jgi:hypothetical protein
MLSHSEYQLWWVGLWSAGFVLTVAWFAVTSDRQAGDARAGQQLGGRSPLPDRGSWRTEGDAVLAASVVLTLGAAAIHAAVIRDHFEESRLFGTFFVLATLLQLTWAAAVFIVPSRTLVVLGAAGNTALILVWILSRTSGLPVGPEPWTPEPVGGLDLFASMFEAVAVYFSLLFLLRPAPLSRGPRHLSQKTWGLAATVAVVVGLLILLSGGGHHA